MDCVILNSIEVVKNDSNIEVAKCLLQLQAIRVEKATIKIEDLYGSEQKSSEKILNDLGLK